MKQALVCLLVCLSFCGLHGQKRIREISSTYTVYIGYDAGTTFEQRVICSYRDDIPSLIAAIDIFKRESTIQTPGDWYLDNSTIYTSTTAHENNQTVINYYYVNGDSQRQSQNQYVYDSDGRLTAIRYMSLFADNWTTDVIEETHYNTYNQIDSVYAFRISTDGYEGTMQNKFISTFDQFGHRISENRFDCMDSLNWELITTDTYYYNGLSFPAGFQPIPPDLFPQSYGRRNEHCFPFPVDSLAVHSFYTGQELPYEKWTYSYSIQDSIRISSLYHNNLMNFEEDDKHFTDVYDLDGYLIRNTCIVNENQEYPYANSYSYAAQYIWEEPTPAVDPVENTPPLIVSAYPNPFRNTVRFTTSAKDITSGSLVIYNIKGQKVKHLALQDRNVITWDGTDETCSPVGTGIYLYKLETPQGNAAGKLIKIAK